MHSPAVDDRVAFMNIYRIPSTLIALTLLLATSALAQPTTDSAWLEGPLWGRWPSGDRLLPDRAQ